MSSPRDLIAASSPSYPGLMLGHADEILQRLHRAGYEVVQMWRVCGERYPTGDRSDRRFCQREINHEMPHRFTAPGMHVAWRPAALGEPEAKEAADYYPPLETGADWYRPSRGGGGG